MGLPLNAIDRLALVAALLVAACTSTITVKIGDWNATCTGMSAADCEGVAGVFINNLARNGEWVLNESHAKLSIVTRRSCPTVPEWANPGSCWQATANATSGPICMVIARQVDPEAGGFGFGQVGGDEMAGRAGGPPPGWPTCE